MEAISRQLKEKALTEWKSLGNGIDIKLADTALDFTINSHGNDKRASGELYFNHPIRVARRVAKLMPETTTIIAALLHDTVEDTGKNIQEISDMFGKDVGKLVNSLTKVKKSRSLTLQKLFKVGYRDIRAIVIKLIDRLDNLDDLGALPRHKQIRIANESFVLYAEIAHGLGLLQIENEIRNKAFEIRSPKRYHYLQQQIKRTCQSRKSSTTVVKNKIEENLRNINAEVLIEMKQPHDYMKSIRRIFDTPESAIIITTAPEDCFTAMGYLHMKFHCVPLTIRDYISNPKSNGWQGLVSEIMIDGTQVPVNFMTQGMYNRNYYGILNLLQEGLYHHHHYQKFLDLYIEVGLDSSMNEQRIEDIFKSTQGEPFQTMTPKGDVIELSYGATILDFAFMVHSSLGLSCIGGEIEGVLYSYDKKIREGDIVKIITDKSVIPNKNWHKILVTRRARKELDKYFNKHTKTPNN